ncbi:MAG: 3-oxoacid CoA-transferase, partial [Deltaproteobacteria bacterium]|nr:3-oxoacid CoA-transferase [Deltaproteobacteria bacterium]
TPGFLTGPGAREKAGLPKETGPYRVVTTLAVMDFEPKSKRMRLIATNPGVTVDDVVKNTGFELLMAERIQQNEPPQEKELHTLRDEIDKDRLYI